MIDRVLIVTGGRRFYGRAFLWAKMDEWQPDMIVHGDAVGADAIANNWARQNGIPRVAFGISQRQWQLYGKNAGSVRNQQMIEFVHSLVCLDDEMEPDYERGHPLVQGMAMPGGTGTADMCERMSAEGIVYWDYRDDPSHWKAPNMSGEIATLAAIQSQVATCAELGMVRGQPHTRCNNGYRAPELIKIIETNLPGFLGCPYCGTMCNEDKHATANELR